MDLVLTDWELGELRNVVAAKALTYAGHRAGAGLFPDEEATYQKYNALHEKLAAVGLPDLTKTSIPELMQRLAETEEPAPSYGPIELRVILHHVREVVRYAWCLMDNAEEVDGRHVIDAEDFDNLSKAMDKMDEIAAMDTQVVGHGGHAVTMAMDMLLRNNKDVRDALVRELSNNILALNCGERSKELAKAGFLAALMKYNRDHANAAPIQS